MADDPGHITDVSSTTDPLEARVVVFRQQPDATGFAALRQELRDAGRGELLADVCATWAQHEKDPVRAADAWSEAGEAMIVLGEPLTAIEYLRTSLELDPTNDRASDRLLEIVEPNDPAAAVEIIEGELVELARRDAARKRPELTQRRAAQHRRAAVLWNDDLGRVDRALWHFQQAFKLEPQRTEALEAARDLYRSLGDDAMVGKLYQAELEVLGKDAPPAKKASLRLELGRLAQRGKDLEGAAHHLEEAARLDPGSLEISEALADVYSTPGFRDGQTRGKAGELFVELGKSKLRERDDQTGINYLRRAVGVDPYTRASSNALEEALQGSSQWDELERMLRHRTGVVQDPDERKELLRRRAALYRNQLPNREGLIEVLTELVAYEVPGSKNVLELKELLRDDNEWEELSHLMEAEITALGQDPNTPTDYLVNEILELATIAREHQNDRDRAAELLHQALGISPTHEEALARYVDHFRERRDWGGLLNLYEFALDNARDAGADADDMVRRLEEIAQLAELRLGDIPRAIEAWQRIAELSTGPEGPGSPKVTEALRRLTSRGKMWEQLVQSLETEVASAGDPVSRMQSLKKMAQTYRERQLEPRRAIELYEQVLAEHPDDDATLKALVELYEKEGDDVGLAHSLRRQLDLEADRLNIQAAKAGRTEGPKDWPVAKRSERLNVLRRLAQLYETRLADVDGVVYSCSAVLELLSGDRDALDRMERVLEKANDPRLEQTLEYHAAASTSPAERAKLLKRLAKLATDRHDDVRALERWESTLRASPSDPEALATLRELYERAQRWAELAQILERLDGGRPLPSPGTPDAAVRVFDLETYANLLEAHLGDPVRAIKAYHRVLELTPKSRTALEALARLYREASKWRELTEILSRQTIVLVGSNFQGDLEKAAEVAMESASILEERLGSPNDAIKTLDGLLREINPNHLEAHTALRRLHEARGDFDAAVRIAEREMYLSPEPIRKVSRGLEIGFICRDRLGNPTRALQAFKRVLELEPEQEEAMAATADLLAKLGRWKEYVAMLERRLARSVAQAAADPEASAGFADDRRVLVQRIAAATADKLGDPRGAFRWWRRAHDEAPDEQTLADVRRASEAYGLWRELAEVLTDERKRLIAAGGGLPVEPERFVALSRELAQLCERRLGDKPRGIEIFSEALAAAPRDGELLVELERLAAELDQRPVWKHVLDAFELVLAAATPSERVELYLRRARILDERTGDSKGAVADALAAFSWAPDRDDVRHALELLAPKARAWNDLIAVDSALIERAATTQRRVELLRRRAQTIEDQLKDAPRAFRSHLVALLLAPEDGETSSHLWRLARVIGKYREADKAPRAEPPAATIQGESAVAEAVATANRAGVLRRRVPMRAQTDPLTDEDLATANLSVGDSTQPLDLTELEMAEAKRAREVDQNSFAQPENSTMQLSMTDLAKLVVPPAGPPASPSGPVRRALPGVGSGPTKLPPPPPRPPQITAQSNALAGARSRRVSAPPPMPRKAQAPVRRPPLPSLTNRLFETPWEELAIAYESLPAPDPTARLRWLFRASEVWETGGKDIARAFDALARAFAIAKRAPEGDAEVRARLHRIASEHKAWDRLADLYEGLAEQAETAHAAADLLMEVATIRFEQKRPRETEAQLRRILGMLPADEAARARLEHLYRAESRWVELAASIEERTDPRLGTAAPEAERAQLLRELAAIYTDRVNRPHDAIDAFERLRLLAPAEPPILFKLAELYGAVSRWSKVIESLTKVSEIAEGSEDARIALRQIAKIYENELEQRERAIDAYQQLVTTWPDDEAGWAALDALYTAQARWTELGDVLRRRAGLAREPAERAQLLSRRAGVLLEWLASPEEAAAALRHARTILPDDPKIADQLVIALGKAGREREAAAVLESRIASDPTGRSKGDLAALHIRLAQLQLDGQQRDVTRASIEAALALVPEHPTALALLAQLQSPDEDPRAFADAKLRESESAKDEDSKIAALMAAADVLSSRVGDLDGAQAAYDRVLALRPYHADATWALAGLSEKGGDPDSATRVLEKKLEDEALTPPEKARILTQLAALSRSAGVTSVTERRLLEALGTVPDHIPAIVALADFYADAERWSDLEAFMRDVLDGTTLAHAPAALVADLHRRLATAHEKLGRDEDAYQTLVAADRLHRGHLLIKLAIGENRYKARRWREAALHLSPLATHEDGNRYPSEVALGLYHAALAEIRSLRPENASPLYQRALELKPNFAPALQALAELAMEGGDHKRAADLLTRQATATEAPAERMRLFEALGDMALLVLHDDERATTCFAAAVAAAQPLEQKHLPLLHKLLERQNLAGDLTGSARSAELMASFGATPAERAALHLQAAYDYVGVGDRVRARAAAERAVENDPYDVGAVDLASQLAIEQSDVEAAANMLTRLLTAKDGRFSETNAAHRTLLSYRLGHARQTRGDTRQALLAFEHAIGLAPESEGATLARRGLVELVKAGPEGVDPARKETIAQHLAAITAHTGALADLVVWADELRRQNKLDGTRASLEVAIACGHTPDVHQTAFLQSHKPHAMRDDESYKTTVAGETDGRALIAGYEASPLAAIAATLAEAAQLMWPDLEEAFGRFNLTGARRVPSSSHAAAVSIFPRLTTALGAGAVMLYQHDDAPDVTVIAAGTPVIVIGPRLAAEGTAVSHAELRALLARAVELTRPEHLAFAGLPPRDATRLLTSVVRLFGPAELRDAVSALITEDDVQRAHDEMVKGALAVKLRSRFELLLVNVPAAALDNARYLAACHRDADRAALLLGGDANVIAAGVRARGETTEHLIRAVGQAQWLSTRAKLGVGIR